MILPSYNSSSQKGEEGITIVKRIVEKDMNWIFRKNHQEFDFGIDGFIDIMTDHNQLTGKSIALQIKTGSSYFSESTVHGWIYRDDIAHLNYYLNHDIPVLILLVDDREKKVYWNVCDASRTERAGSNWKITISSSNQFNVGCKQEIQKYVSPVRDYAAQLDHFWTMNNMLMEVGLLVFNVDRAYIEKKNYQYLEDGINRLQVNSNLIEKMRGNVDIWIDGYNEDPRELYEIPEVILWIRHLHEHVVGLSYFLATHKTSSFLRVMQYVNVKHEVVMDNITQPNGRRRRQTILDMSTSKPFLDSLFHDLNVFCEKHKLALSVNKERTYAIAEFLINTKIPRHLKE